MTEEWSEASLKLIGTVNGAEPEANIWFTLQPGGYDGIVEVEWIKISREEDPFVVVAPENGEIIKSFNTGKEGSENLGGWGSIEWQTVEEDGVPCLSYVNEGEEVASWQSQFGFMCDLEADEVYYINFDVKGTEKSNSAEFQYDGENNDGGHVWWGCGSLSPYNVTEDWNNVTIYGIAHATTQEGQNPNKIVFSFGYVGTCMIKNMTLYKAKADLSAVETIAPVKVDSAVYNFQGVKVANSLEEVTVPGLYIANGKKVVKK